MKTFIICLFVLFVFQANAQNAPNWDKFKNLMGEWI